jgi:hypothetical protein
MAKGLGGAVSDITFGEGDKVYSGKDLEQLNQHIKVYNLI